MLLFTRILQRASPRPQRRPFSFESLSSPRTSKTSSSSNPNPNTPPSDGNASPNQNGGQDPPSFLGHPFRLVIQTLKFVAFAHLFWEYAYCMAPASGPSMLPTFEILGEWLIVDKTHRLGRNLCVGDMVSYNIPDNQENGVKRVIGLPGDYVLMGTPGIAAGNMIQVPEGHCWLVGDNLPASRDSRLLGPIPLALVKGKVVASVRPYDHTYRWFSNPMKDGIE